jgi:hypothetical protein
VVDRQRESRRTRDENEEAKEGGSRVASFPFQRLPQPIWVGKRIGQVGRYMGGVGMREQGRSDERMGRMR